MQESNIEQNNSYNKIAKGLGLFGGVQIIKVLIGIINTKFIAILIGTAGVGIQGLLTSTTALLSSITNMGLSTSAVRTISDAYSSDDKTLISSVIVTLRRWVFFTGIAGALITLIFASKLSLWVFGSGEYFWAFIWLSLSILFQAICIGQLAILQGLYKLKLLAKANVIGSALGLCISLPLIYLFRIKGIVPSIIITAASNLIISWYFVRKIKVGKVKMTIMESYYSGLNMVKLGSVVMFTNLANTGVIFLVQLYIGKTGGIEQVGLYASSLLIINGYIGMIFTAMGTDFFPRLCAVNTDNLQIKKMVNQQAEIILLILGPILIFIVSSLPLVIRILFTPKFMPIVDLIQWAIPGVVFQALCWTLGLTILAKGNFKIYFVIEITFQLLILITNIFFYHFLKLEGIGIAFMVMNFFGLILLLPFVMFKYSFSYERPFIKIFLIQLIFILISVLAVWRAGFPLAYFSGIILFIGSTLYSYFELKKRFDLKTILRKIKNQGNKK